MAKIERKYLAHYVDTSADQDNPVFERLGKDLEEFSAELSAQVDTKKNILGETSVMISGYEKTGSVEPYYAEAGTGLFERLQNIIDNSLVLDSLKTAVVEVKLWEEQGEGAYPATMEEAFIEVKSYGGDTSGYQIPFALHFTGKKTAGVFNLDTRIFTAEE